MGSDIKIAWNPDASHKDWADRSSWGGHRQPAVCHIPPLAPGSDTGEKKNKRGGTATILDILILLRSSRHGRQAINDQNSPGFTFQQTFTSFHKMENLPYEIIAASKPFRFLVGPDKKAFTMHADLVSHLSKPLAALINGNMKEAREGYAELPEVDEGTFVLFCQFAYTGNYRLSSRVKTSELMGKPLRFASNSFSPHKMGMGRAPRTAPSINKSMSSLLWDRFKERTYTVPDPQPPSKEIIQDVLLETDVDLFLSHARVYVMADCYDIERLRILSLQKLHKSLAISLDLIPKRYIIALAQYCFENTVDKGDVKDPLRDLVIKYIACHMNWLWNSDGFQDAVGFSSELSKALVGALASEFDKTWDQLARGE
ncbi:hypothetical protein F4775DRAFT_187476 [Biscogniauxia sp. FL1348]|nr:hypothetical protein F4775DRAFT_187476 [Biscogniauxia sp. FL1348]